MDLRETFMNKDIKEFLTYLNDNSFKCTKSHSEAIGVCDNNLVQEIFEKDDLKILVVYRCTDAGIPVDSPDDIEYI